MATTPKTIDEYITLYPKEVQEVLQKFRQTIKQAAPEAQEAIKYAIPTFVQQGNMISFAAYKNHVALYPTPAGDAAFQKEIEPYRAAKSTLQFKFGAPMPYPLIKQAVTFRVKEHLENAAAKAKAKKRK